MKKKIIKKEERKKIWVNRPPKDKDDHLRRTKEEAGCCATLATKIKLLLRLGLLAWDWEL